MGAPDIAKAREFYRDVFSWTVQPGGPETGGYSVAELNGKGVAGLGPKMGSPEAPAMWMTYMATSDADAQIVNDIGTMRWNEQVSHDFEAARRSMRPSLATNMAT
jgi:hypothetical protein